MLPEHRIVRDHARSRALAHRVHPRATLPGHVVTSSKLGSRVQTPSLVATKSDKFQHNSLIHAVKEGLSLVKHPEPEDVMSEGQPSNIDGPNVQRDVDSSIVKESAQVAGPGQLSLFDVALLKHAKPKTADELAEYEIISKPNAIALDESTISDEQLNEWEKVENEWKESVKLERTYAQVVMAV